MKVETLVVVSTPGRSIINVTSCVLEKLRGVEEGVVFVTTPHTTAGLFFGEDDPALCRDYLKVVEGLLAPLGPFEHVGGNNPNTEAHIMSAMFGAQVSFTVENTIPLIGVYQGILFLEMDGPKERKIHIRVIE